MVEAPSFVGDEHDVMFGALAFPGLTTRLNHTFGQRHHALQLITGPMKMRAHAVIQTLQLSDR